MPLQVRDLLAPQPPRWPWGPSTLALSPRLPFLSVSTQHSVPHQPPDLCLRCEDRQPSQQSFFPGLSSPSFGPRFF